MGKKTLAGGAIVGSQGGSTVVLAAGATPSMDLSLGNVFTLTPGENETIATANALATGNEGDLYTLKVLTSGASSFTLTFGTGFKATGTLATGTTTAKVFVIVFINIGGTLYEVSRTTAM